MVQGSCSGPVDERPWSSLGYLEWHDRAARYHKAGQRQKHCTKCAKWRWDDEACCDAPRQTAREYDAETRVIARAVKRQYPSATERYRRELRKAIKEGRVA